MIKQKGHQNSKMYSFYQLQATIVWSRAFCDSQGSVFKRRTSNSFARQP